MGETETRLVKVVKPSIPVWAVYFDDGIDSLGTEPILFFTVYEHRNSRGECYSSFAPVPFCSDFVSEESGPDESENFLGLSLSEDPSVKDWQAQINRYVKRGARSAV